LPQLEKKRPAEIIEALQHRTSDLGEAMEDASLAFAFSQMSERARKHLPSIGLFTSYVDADVLGFFMTLGEQGKPVYTELVGEALNAEGWEAILEEAARSGLLSSPGSRVYELHPTLPVFLRRQLVAAIGEDGLNRLDTEFLNLYAAIAQYYFEAARKADRNAIAMLSIEEANLLRALRLAEKNEQWGMGGQIVQTLNEFYEITNRTDEWKALRTGLLNYVGREMSTSADRNRARLWMFLIGDEANQALGRGDFGNAEVAYKQALDYLVSINEPSVESMMAVSYHQLGIIAEERQQFDLAEQWYKKALAIYEQLEHPPLAVYTLAQLGVLRRKQERWQESVAWFGKALAIADKYQMRVGRQILPYLAYLMKTMGENEFVAVWQQAFLTWSLRLTRCARR
jgi:tetratricopeptide (TPR) repeat protein